MRREDLCHAIRERLVRLPEPFQAHYGVVPPSLPEDAVPLGAAVRKVEEAIADDLKDAHLIIRYNNANATCWRQELTG